jgi:hypothetical protein
MAKKCWDYPPTWSLIEQYVNQSEDGIQCDNLKDFALWAMRETIKRNKQKKGSAL